MRQHVPQIASSNLTLFPSLHKHIYTRFIYFVWVLGTGFALGMVRVPLRVPRIGERWAALAEMPRIATAIFFSAGYIVRRFPEIKKARARPDRRIAGVDSDGERRAWRCRRAAKPDPRRLSGSPG